MALSSAVSADEGFVSELSLEEFQEYEATHDGFWELQKGVPVEMESASDEHQWISLEVAAAFRAYLKGHQCTVRQDRDVWTGKMPFTAEARRKKASIRKPDVLIYCSKEQRQSGVTISPQLVVEIWSPTNSRDERNKKMEEYFRIGVQEFWEIYQETQDFSIFSFKDHNLRFLSSGTFHDLLESEYFPGLKVDLSEYYTEFIEGGL